MEGREVWSAYTAMRVRTPQSLAGPPPNRRARHHTSPESEIAEQLLGVDHPLAAAARRAETASAQLRVVAATGLIACCMLPEAGETAASLLVAAVAVAIVLALRLTGIFTTRRALSLQLIAEGRACVAIGSVQRALRDLTDPAHRERLARTLEDLARARGRPRPYEPSVIVVDPGLLCAIRPELLRLAEQLRSEQPCVRGVALTELLLTEPDSPLHGADLQRLREELRRLRYLLAL